MTAEEFIKYCDSLEKKAQFETRLKSYKQYNTCTFLMGKYAEMKCKQLLEIVAENASAKLEYDCCIIDKDFILNCVDIESFCAGTAF